MEKKFFLIALQWKYCFIFYFLNKFQQTNILCGEAMKFANRVEVDQTALRLTEVLYAAVCSCGLNPSQHMQFGDALLHINCRSYFSPPIEWCLLPLLTKKMCWSHIGSVAPIWRVCSNRTTKVKEPHFCQFSKIYLRILKFSIHKYRRKKISCCALESTEIMIWK